MSPLVQRVSSAHTPETLLESLPGGAGRILLRSACFDLPHARYSLVAAEPFLTLRVEGSACELRRRDGLREVRYGNPWRLLEALMARFELLDQVDHPFPLGGAFGYWGFGLARFVEPRLRPRVPGDLEVPDAVLGFHDSLVVFDHHTGGQYVVSTGLEPDGSRDSRRARAAADLWRRRLDTPPAVTPAGWVSGRGPVPSRPELKATHDRSAFVRAVDAARRYIRSGDIYQVNLAQRFGAAVEDPWSFWKRLFDASPAPFALFLDAGDLQLASISPELFLRLSGGHILTRPIKGTRPRSVDPTTDAQLAYELQTSPKETAELVMITDLLRNDLGRVAEYGSVRVPDLLRLERFAHVQHLVSTVEADLRPEVTHLAALEACFPGGSITGAPKVRALEIIDELEPVARGPYTGCAGYLGFNRESTLNILIRTAVFAQGQAWYHAGAGIVADSDPDAEYDETLAKARAFLDLVRTPDPRTSPVSTA